MMDQRILNLTRYGAEIDTVLGADTLPGGLVGGPASSISYHVLINTPSGPIVCENVVPSNPRHPDVIDTIAAKPGDPVGLTWRGDELRFLIFEGYLLDEECT